MRSIVLRPLPAIVLLTTLTICVGLQAEGRGAAVPARAQTSGSVQITLGPVETVAASSVAYTPDAKYFTYSCGGTTYGVVSGGYGIDDAGYGNFTGEDHTFLLTDPLGTGVSLTPEEAVTGLEPGSAFFDAKGNWLDGVYLSPDGILHGYYHAEHPIPQPINPLQPHKSLAYAESTDCGHTWTKPDYPNNQIITGSTAVPDNQAGDGSVTVIGDYLYLFYNEQFLPVLARSALADAGRPGTWWKYYCGADGSCDFTEPGLGGQATPLSGRQGNTVVSYNTYLGAYLSTDNAIGRGILDLKVSSDAITWSSLVQSSVPLPPLPQGFEYYYPSNLSLDGESGVSGQSFWIYYVALDPNSPVSRLLLRQEVTLNRTP